MRKRHKKQDSEDPGSISFLGRLQRKLLKKKPFSAKEELSRFMEKFKKNGIKFTPQEKLIFKNLIDIKEKTAEDIMVPRLDLACLDINSDLSKIKRTLKEYPYSRFVVYAGDLDEPRGFVTARDLANIIASGSNQANLGNYINEILAVPGSKKITNLLAEMRVKNIHMAIILDEHGGTDGVVTIGDIISSIVGNLETISADDEDSEITWLSNNMAEVSSRIRLEDLEKYMDLQIEDQEKEDCDTIGGLIFLKCGRVPVKGEFVSYNGDVRFEVIEADLRKIKKVRIHNIRKRY